MSKLPIAIKIIDKEVNTMKEIVTESTYQIEKLVDLSGYSKHIQYVKEQIPILKKDITVLETCSSILKDRLLRDKKRPWDKKRTLLL